MCIELFLHAGTVFSYILQESIYCLICVFLYIQLLCDSRWVHCTVHYSTTVYNMCSVLGAVCVCVWCCVCSVFGAVCVVCLVLFM